MCATHSDPPFAAATYKTRRGFGDSTHCESKRSIMPNKRRGKQGSRLLSEGDKRRKGKGKKSAWKTDKKYLEVLNLRERF